jgi:hypothetical protein
MASHPKVRGRGGLLLPRSPLSATKLLVVLQYGCWPDGTVRRRQLGLEKSEQQELLSDIVAS